MNEDSLTVSELNGRLTKVLANHPLTPEARDLIHLAVIRLAVLDRRIETLEKKRTNGAHTSR